MPAVMAIVLGLTIAGILAMFLVWRELDLMDRFWEEMDEWERLSAMLECSEYEEEQSNESNTV